MTQGHMGRSGGGWCNARGMLHCAPVAFFSRPESGVICMTDDDFVRVVVDKGKEKEGEPEDETNL